MHDPHEAITDLDLTSYVDGQLDDWHAARVEAWLADHPRQAAAVLQDIRLQRELRIALSNALSSPASDGVQRASLRLARGLNRDALWRRGWRLGPVLGPVLVLLGLAGLGAAGKLPVALVGAVSAWGGPPAYVTAALAARDASNIRLPMQSVAEDPDLDPEELRAMTGILLPRFAPDWQLLDAQIFPSPQGPGVEMVFDVPDLGRVSHFAVRPGDFALRLPQSLLLAGQPISWFQIGETAHVLIATAGDSDQLQAAAQALVDSLY